MTFQVTEDWAKRQAAESAAEAEQMRREHAQTWALANACCDEMTDEDFRAHCEATIQANETFRLRLTNHTRSSQRARGIVYHRVSCGIEPDELALYNPMSNSWMREVSDRVRNYR